MVKRKTITISEEVLNELRKLKEKLRVNNYDLVLRYLIGLPPFEKVKEYEKKH